MSDAIVSVSQLTKQFKSFTAVSNLSFDVYAGDVYGFLGQNGAGKSTTIRMLLTLIAPTSGSISMFGYQLPHHRNDILRQVGAVVERPDLYKFLSAYDNLDIFARLSGIRPTRKILMEQLDRVQLATRAKDRAGTFSQGMKQRLGIAIALVHNPKLIILDEPTNGLDPQGIADMRQMIITLREEHNKTVIVSSHLLYEVEQIATRMIIIHNGKKIVEGSTAELFDPANTEVILETPEQHLPEKMRGSTYAAHATADGSGWRFRLHAHEVPMLAKALTERDIQIYNLSKTHSLENLFLNLTKDYADHKAQA